MTLPNPTNLKTLKLMQRVFGDAGRVSIDDGLSLYRHGKSPVIWGDHRLPGGARKRKSTQTKDFGRAVEIARRTHRELVRQLASGQPVTVSGVTVGSLLTAYADALAARLMAGDHSVKPELSVLRRNLIPYWREVLISALSRQHFYAWETWRTTVDPSETEIRSYQRRGRSIRNETRRKPPSAGTLQREKTYFVSALTWGSDQVQPWVSDAVVEEIRHLPRRSSPSKKRQYSRVQRPALSDWQVSALLHEGSRWEEVEKSRRHGKQRNYSRRLMMCHVRFLLATGLRPGAEINDLTWDKIEVQTLASGQKIVVVSPCGDGKTGPRIVNSTPEAVQVINDLRALLTTFGFPCKEKASLWPSLKGGTVKDLNGSFKTVMKKLKFDVTVSEEPLYMCRHTYITQRLAKNVSSDLIAQNCGTSVEMIERHYKHLKAEQIRDALVPSDRVDPSALTLARLGGGEALVLDTTSKSVRVQTRGAAG